MTLSPVPSRASRGWQGRLTDGDVACSNYNCIKRRFAGHRFMPSSREALLAGRGCNPVLLFQTTYVLKQTRRMWTWTSPDYAGSQMTSLESEPRVQQLAAALSADRHPLCRTFSSHWPKWGTAASKWGAASSDGSDRSSGS